MVTERLTRPVTIVSREAPGGYEDTRLRTLALPAEPGSAARARRAIERELASTCPPELVDIASLLATELVTNAVRHARTAMRFGVQCVDGKVRIEVEDGSPALPVRREPTTTAVDGRGLLLVDRLAATWGFEHRPHGKVVWLELSA
jgi:anti-sigma regulatory factor (Ser/Thr protein kinase)